MHRQSGSGKTTLVKTITNDYPNFTRLSIDEIIFAEHGIYGVDYPADEALYKKYQEEADDIYLKAFQTLLQKREDIIVERSFYAKSDRDEFKSMIEDGGGRCVLVYLKAMDKETLWQRICDRSKEEKTANSAFLISRERFETYWNGFEGPDGEEEVVLEVCQKA